MSTARLIVFVRYPVAGRVKTRLIPVLGEDGAASLSRSMAEHTLKWASRLSGKRRADLEVRFDGGSIPEMAAWLGENVRCIPQGDGDLGDRMSRAFRDSFMDGVKKTVLIGTDIPELTVFHIRAAWKTLDENDAVLVPAPDGGYGLIGLRRFSPEIFQGLAWGTNTVLEGTLAKAADLGLCVKTFPAQPDVDVAADLPVWERTKRRFLSIVIPTLNEGPRLKRTLDSISGSPDTEVIVADGGSRDETLSIARKAGTKIVSCRPGRGGQLNAGATEASGSILLFLHADTLLPDNHAALVRGALEDPLVAGGSFALKFEPGPPLLKINEITANWRTRLFHLPFGDQALFVRGSLFRLLGGYKNIPLMEDVDFARRLHRAGRTVVLRPPVLTSSRKYAGGYWRRSITNKVVFAGYFLGVSPERLANLYQKKNGLTDEE